MPSLEYVLERSKSRRPHCFAAHVPGQGYVNRGETLADDLADYWRQYQRAATSEIENMGYAPAYAIGQGYDNGHKGEDYCQQPKRGVLMANWNRLAHGLDSILERMGFAVEWSDEWTTCEDCNKAIRTEPDGYDWKPAYVESAGGWLCLECAPDEDSDED